MCNLYSVTKGQKAILEFSRAMRDQTGNMPPLPGIFPDFSAPIVRTGADGVRELVMARWGMPCPPIYGNQPVTNIRNVKSPHWRAWLGTTSRCLVPATSFSEYEPEPDPILKRKAPVWFALDESRPLFAFAGIWTQWRGVRKKAEGEMLHDVFGFLTTDANGIVAPIHPSAMPVILTGGEEMELWLKGEAEVALKLQRPLPDAMLKVVARGEKEDRVPAV